MAIFTATYHLAPYLSPKMATPSASSPRQQYPLHTNVIATMFWVGEPASPDNQYIANTASAWDANWMADYGGVDKPSNRCGYQPCNFTPKQNAFYFALPFNDYDNSGALKPLTILRKIPWYHGTPTPHQSLVKNHWIAVTYNHRTVYGQWEDVGPFNENDVNYVFGTTPPMDRVGLDLSPSMNDYLQLHGEGKVSWRFISQWNIPDGPWWRNITNSGTDY